MKKIIFFALIFASLIVRINAQTPADKYAEGMRAFNLELYVKAHGIFEEFFNEYKLMDELYATAKFYSAEALLNVGNYDAAAADYEFLVNHFHWSNFRDKALYKLGLIYFESEQYTRSRARLQTILNDYPNSEHTGSALYWIGESYTEQNRLEDAIAFLEEAVTNKQENKYADYSLFTLASIYEKIGDYENAVKYYDQLLSFHQKSPLAPSAQIRIGISYFKLKDYQDSILVLNNPLLSDLPEDLYSESLYLLANSYYRVEEYADAEKTYLEILREFPNSDVSREVEYGLAWSYFQQKKYEEAYDIFDQLSDGSDSIGIKSFYWKGESMRYAGRENEAFKIFNEFLEKFPNSSLAAGVQYQMGALYYNSDRFDQAGKYLSYATGSNEADIQARSFVLLGDIALSKKQFEPARKNFESAINIPGINLDLQNSAMLGLGVSLFYLQKPKEALPYLTDVDYRDPSFESDKLNFYLAETNFALGKFQEALSRYQKVDISNEEIGSFALYGRAYTYFSLRDYGNAALQFADFIKKFPQDSKNIDARLRLADSYYGSRNFAAASKVYQELFKVKSGGFDDPNAQYQYAQALYKAGSTSDAMKEFRDLQASFPNSEFADRSLYVVGWIYFQQGNFNEAVSNYRNVLRTYPRSSLSPIIYYSIGDAYFNIGRYDSAIVNYQKLLTDFPTSNYVFDAVNGLQYSYVAQGNPERAIALIDEFVSRNPGLSFSDQIYFKKGEIYYSQRSYELSKQSYKEFAGNYPKSKLLPDAYYWIGKSAQNLQQHEEAIFNFNRVFEMNPNSETGIASVLEIGNIHNAQKNYDAAISIYDKALSKIPPDSKRKAEVLYMKGLTLINKGNPTESYPVFEEVAQYYPGTIFADKAKFEVALIELSMGRHEVADQYFKNLAETRTDDLGAQSQYYYGLSLLEQNKINEAISAFVRVRTVFGGYDEWLARSFLKMGEAYTMLDDNEKAKEMYRAVLTKHKGDSFGQEAQAKLRELQ